MNEFDFKNDYNSFLEYLFSLQDLKYQAFHSKLLKCDREVIGIQTPKLKALAKNIAKQNYLEYLTYCPLKYYEEIVIYGLIITYLKDFEVSLKFFETYINYIDNWASCDIVVANYKLFSKHLEQGLLVIKQYLSSKQPWKIRVGLVLLLDYYINDQYISVVLQLVNKVTYDHYYVKMANAWLLSICLIKYYDKTYEFLNHCDLDDWTYNKALQKAIESYRISDKEALRKLKK